MTRSTVSSSRGFTLVELLVVVAIIATLAALILPSVSLARSLAQRTSCASKMRQIGMAYHTWSGDHDDKGVPTYWEGQTWDAELADVMSNTGVFWCPSNREARRGYDDSGTVKRSKGGHAADRRSYALISGVYTWNMWGVNGNETVASTSAWYSEPWREPYITAKSLGSIPSPSTTAILVEVPDNRLGAHTRAFNFWRNPYVWHDNRLQQIHRGTDNYLFLDGHVEAKRRDQARGTAGAFLTGTKPKGVWTIDPND